MRLDQSFKSYLLSRLTSTFQDVYLLIIKQERGAREFSEHPFDFSGFTVDI